MTKELLFPTFCGIVVVFSMWFGVQIAKTEITTIIITNREIELLYDPAFCGNDNCNEIINRWKTTKKNRGNNGNSKIVG
jgi:hypothetical protein